MAIKKKVVAKKPAPRAAVKKAPAPKAAPELDMAEEFEDREDVIDDTEIEDGDDVIVEDQEEEFEDAQEDEEIQDDEGTEDGDEEEEIEPVGNPKAVATRNSTAPIVSKSAELASWGTPKISNQDITIPKILLMQQMTPRVVKPAEGQKRASMGQFRDSLTDRLMGDETRALEVVPFYLDKIWVVYKIEMVKGKQVRTFDRVVPVDSNPNSENYNDTWGYRVTKNGQAFENVRVMNFYVLLCSDVAKGAALPYVLPFKSSGMTAGKKLATQMYVSNVNENKAPPAYTVKLNSTITSNNAGTFAVPNITRSRASTEAELDMAYHWYQIVQKGRASVDDSDIGQAEKPAANTDDVEY